MSHVSAKSPCGFLCVSSSTRLSNIRPSIRSDCPSLPILGSRLVGMDSIRKLTTPGSVAMVREQEERRKIEERRREVKEAKEVKDAEEVKEPSTVVLT